MVMSMVLMDRDGLTKKDGIIPISDLGKFDWSDTSACNNLSSGFAASEVLNIQRPLNMLSPLFFYLF
jgi:hypothetical protein